MTTRVDLLDHTGFETKVAYGVVADEDFVKRDGGTFVGVAASAMTVGYASGLRETGGPTNLPMGAVGEGDYIRRLSSTVVGQTPTALAAAVKAIQETITPAADAAYDWNTTAANIAVTHDAAACDVSLPAEAAVTNWPPGDPPRKLFKMNTSVNGINLLTAATCTINGGAADANMSPIPDSDADPSNTVLAQWVYVYRQTATAYWVWGGA